MHFEDGIRHTSGACRGGPAPGASCELGRFRGRSAAGGARGVWSTVCLSCSLRLEPGRTLLRTLAGRLTILRRAITQKGVSFHESCFTRGQTRGTSVSRERDATVTRVRGSLKATEWKRGNIVFEEHPRSAARCAPHCVTAYTTRRVESGREGQAYRGESDEAREREERRRSPRGGACRSDEETVSGSRGERKGGKDHIFGQHGHHDRRPAGAVGAISSGE